MGNPWSAIRINKLAGSIYAINDDIIIYVSPNGDDVNGDGSFGTPYYSPHRALEYLKDKVIGATASVEINCAAGIYNFNTRIVPSHDQGDRIRIIGAEPEVYKIRGCRGYTGAAGALGSFAHMKLITSTGDGAGGMTTEHGLTSGDVGKWMLIFQKTQYTNGDYPVARKHFLGSLQDNKDRTGQHSWGNGNGSTAGLQWTKIVGSSEIIGVTGAAARGSEVSNGESHITIEKHRRSPKWKVEDMIASYETPASRDDRKYYNDWGEEAVVSVNPAANGRKFVDGENIAVLAEYGDDDGHTANFVPSTEMEIEGRVMRTVFKFTSSDAMVRIVDNHKLGRIENIIFKAENYCSYGIYVGEGGRLSDFEYTFNSPQYYTQNVGVVGAETSWIANKDGYINGIRLAADAYTHSDGSACGTYGFLANNNSTHCCNLSVSIGMVTGYHVQNTSIIDCTRSLAGHCSRASGWMGFPHTFDYSTIPVGGYIYQEFGKFGDPFLGKINSINESTYRVSITSVYGLPNTEDSGSNWFWMNSNSEDAIEAAENDTDDDGVVGGNSSVSIARSSAVPNANNYIDSHNIQHSGTGFKSYHNSTMSAQYSIATGLGYCGFAAAMQGQMQCGQSLAFECREMGYFGWLGRINAIDSAAVRCSVGYLGQQSGCYMPYTMCVNNVHTNYHVTEGYASTGNCDSVEGFDMALAYHKLSSRYGRQTSNFHHGKVYRCANDTDGIPLLDPDVTRGVRGDGLYNIGKGAWGPPMPYKITEDGMIEFVNDISELSGYAAGLFPDLIPSPEVTALGHPNLGGI
ncbi:MAG: hypothetical protein H8D80_01040 [Proteobacteria bacterium]|nr:hypothetical protein [Pseudomonadota bacterium]